MNRSLSREVLLTSSAPQGLTSVHFPAAARNINAFVPEPPIATVEGEEPAPAPAPAKPRPKR